MDQSNEEPPVVHGSGFGTFSLASASPINTSKNGGSSAAVIAGKPPASTPSSASMNRNSRSPASLSRGGGGGAGGSGGTGTALTRADLVREHSRQRQRQMNDQRSSGHGSLEQRQRVSPERKQPDRDRSNDYSANNERRGNSLDGRRRDRDSQTRDDNDRHRPVCGSPGKQPHSLVDEDSEEGRDEGEIRVLGSSDLKPAAEGNGTSTVKNNGTTGMHSTTSARHGSNLVLNGSSNNKTGDAPVSVSSSAGAGTGTLAGLAGGPTKDAGGKSPTRRGITANGNGATTNRGGPGPAPAEREHERGERNLPGDRPGDRSDRPRPPYARLGLGQGLLARNNNSNADSECGSDRPTPAISQNGAGGASERGPWSEADRPVDRSGTNAGLPSSRLSSSSLSDSGQQGDVRGGGGWGGKRDGYRGGGDYHRGGAGGGPSYRAGSGSGGNGLGGGGVPLGRGVVRERDRPDSPRDRGRYNPTPPQPRPLMGAADHQGTGTLSVTARRASLGYHQHPSARNEWQDNGASEGVSNRGGGGHRRPRSPEAPTMESGSQSPPPAGTKDVDKAHGNSSRGSGPHHGDSTRMSNHTPHHASWADPQSSPPASHDPPSDPHQDSNSRYGSKADVEAPERVHHNNHHQRHHQPPPHPVPSSRPHTPSGWAAQTGAPPHHSSRPHHSHSRRAQSPGGGVVTPGRHGRYPPGEHSGGGDRDGAMPSGARPLQGTPGSSASPGSREHETPGGSPLGQGPQGSPIPQHGSPLGMAPHGTRSSPGAPFVGGGKTGEIGWAGPSGWAAAGGGEGVDGEVGASGGGTTNGWVRRPSRAAVTDPLVILKAEFLELHDMLLESDFQWEESQRFGEVLKLHMDQLMLMPHRHRDSLPPPR